MPHFLTRHAIVTCLLVAATVPAAAITKKPPRQADKLGPEVVDSKIAIAVRGDLSAIAAMLDKQIPNPVAVIDERRGGCVKRKVAGVKISIGCEITGAVTKTGPLTVTANGARLTAAIPLHTQVTVRSSHKLLKGLRETGQADMVIYADVTPKLNPDWSVSLNLNPGYRWTDRPHVDVFGIRITVAGRIEPRLNELLAKVKSDVEKKAQDLNVKAKAQEGWKKLFEPVKVLNDPETWLRAAPTGIAFSGIRGDQNKLTASVEANGKIESFVGRKPAAGKPTDLPVLSENVAAPGKFEFVAPVYVDYKVIEQELEKALVKGKAWTPLPGELDVKFTAHDVEVYPSNGKVVVGLKVSADFPGKALDVKGWLFLLGTPEVDSVNKIVRVTKLAFSAETDSKLLNLVATLFQNGPLLHLIEKHVSYNYSKEYESLLTTASTNLSRDLGNGTRTEGKIDSASVQGVHLLAEDIRIDLRASGTLSVIVGQ